MTWIESVARRFGLPARANRKSRRSAPARLRLTQLEDRAVPATLIWDGGGGDNNWTTAANWDTNVAPVAGDDLVFAAGAAQLTNFNDFVGTTFASITIEGDGYTIGGNTVDLTGDVVTTFGTGSTTFDLGIVLGGGDVFVASGGTLNLGGVISGTAGLTVSGGGVLQLSGSGANTYTGTTTVNEGTLVLSKTGATAVTGDLIVGDGTGSDTVRFNSSDQISDAGNVTVALGGVFDLNGFNDSIGALSLTGSTVQTGAGTLTLGGNITANTSDTQAQISGNLDLGGATRTVTIGGGNQDPDLLLSANISGTGAGLTFVGGVTGVELSGNNTYDGLTTISSGSVRAASANALGSPTAGTIVSSGATLALTSNTTITGETLTISGNGVAGILGALNVFASGETNTYAGNIILAGNTLINTDSGTFLVLSGAISELGGASSLTKSGTGTLTLSGTNTYTGTTAVSAGTLATNSLGATSGLTLNGGTLTTAGSSLSTSVPLTLGSGGGTIDLSNGSITLSGISGATGLTVNSTAGGNVLSTSTNNSGTFSGTTTLNGGILQFANDASYGTGTIAINGGRVRTMNAGGQTIANPLSLGGTLQMSGNGPLTFTGDVDLLGGNRTITNTIPSDLTLSGAISNGDLTISNGGSGNPVILSGTNAHGTTTLTAGTLSVTGDANLGTGTVALTGGTLLVTGATTIDNAISLTGAPTVSHDNALTLSGQVSGTGSLVKTGTGTMTLSGANTYTGFTTVNAGTLELSGDAAASTTSLGTIVSGGAVLRLLDDATLQNLSSSGTIELDSADLTGTVVTVITGPITGTGNVSILGSGTLSGTNTYVGSTTIANALTLISNGSAIPDDSAVSVINGGELALAASETIGSLSGNGTVSLGASSLTIGGDNTDTTFSGSMTTGGGTVTKEGTGTFTLTGNNTYTAPTVVAAGTLIVNGSLATTSVTVASGATLGGLGQIAGLTTVQSGGTLAPGNSPGGLTFDAGLTLDAGSTFAVDVDGTTAVTDYDQIFVTGAVDLTGATLTVALGFTPAVGDTFTLIDNDDTDAVVGTFAGLAEGALITQGATTFRISYVGGTGNDVVLTALETPTVSGTTSANPSTVGQPVTFTVTVSGNGTPTGDVALVIDGTTVETVALVGGVATFAPVSNLPVGTRTVAFDYAGDGSNLPSSGSLIQTVEAAPVPPVSPPTVPPVSPPTVPPVVVSVGTGSGVGGTVKLFDLTSGAPGTELQAYTGYTGEIRLASGDVSGDGIADTITAVGSGPTGGHVKVFDGATGELRMSFYAFPGFSGGVFVASGDVDGDGLDDIVASAGAGGTSHVKVFSGKDGSLMHSFLAYDAAFAGGVHVSTGDVDGDGSADIVTGTGAGGAPHVKVFSGKDLSLLRSFYAYESGFTGGVYVSAADFDGDGKADVVTGTGAGGAPHVKVFGGADGAVLSSFLAYEPAFRGGVRVGTGVVDGDTVILTGAGPGGGPHVLAFDLDGTRRKSFFAGVESNTDGVYVG